MADWRTVFSAVVLLGIVLTVAADTNSDASKIISDMVQKKINETQTSIASSVQNASGGGISVSGGCNTNNSSGNFSCVQVVTSRSVDSATTMASVAIVRAETSAPVATPTVETKISASPSSASNLILSSTFLTLLLAIVTKFI